MYLLKEGLFIAFAVFCISFYYGCFTEVESDKEPEKIDVEIKVTNEESSDNSKSLDGHRGPNQVLLASELYTSEANSRVNLRVEPKNITPISVPGLMSRSVETYRNRNALSYKSDNDWVQVTYEQYEQNVRIVAKAFISLGLKKFDGVGILGYNSPEWFYSYLGAIYAGGISVGLHATNEPDACFQCLITSNASIVVVEDRKQLMKILSVKHRLTYLKAIIQYKGEPSENDVYSWDAVMKLGSSESDEKLNDILKSMAVNECCTLVFTSGTEGTPKAVMLSHDNLTFNAHMINNYFPKKSGEETIVSYLPLSHVGTQISDIHSAIDIGAHVYFADKDVFMNTLVNNLQEVKPTFFMGVPRVWQTLKDKLVEIGLESSSHSTTYIAASAKKDGINQHGKARSRTVTEVCTINTLKWFVNKPIKTAIGFDRTKVLITAGAPIPHDVKTYFKSLDMHLYDAFGMSECGGAHAISSPTNYVGGVGKTLKGALSKIDKPDKDGIGELCIYGRHVFMGYLGLLEKTKNTIDSNGWFHTGDLAKIDENGFVTIIGRTNELIITERGENVPPVYIENNVKAALHVISNAFLVGDKKPFLTILLSLKCTVIPYTTVPSSDLTSEVTTWLYSLGSSCTTMSEVIKDKPKKVFEAIQKGIDLANTKAISDAHKIKKFAFIPTDFSVYTGELGPTLKVKRHVVNEKYKDLIEELYSLPLEI